jgi:hypothetical protein
MADDDKIIVSIELDDGSIRQGFIRVQNQADSTFAQIKKTAAGVFGGELLTKAFDTIKDAVKDLFSEAVNQAREADLNIQKLNVALGVSGRYSAEASAAFQELAEKIQATTTVSDDQVLKLENLAITYTKTNAQAMKLTETSVNLAAVTGQDVNSALQQLAGTLSGSAGRLQKLFPDLQQFTKSQLEAGAAVDYFNGRFGGAAAAQVNTFDGRVLQLKNSFDDFLKSMGRLVTESPTVVAIVNFLGQEFRRLASYFKSFSGQDLFAGLVSWLIFFGQGITKWVIAPIEVLYNTAKSVFYGIATIVSGVVHVIIGVVAGAAKLLGPDSELANNLQLLKEATGETTKDMAMNTADAFTSILSDFSASNAIDSFLERMKQATESAAPLKQSFSELGKGAAVFDGSIQSLSQTFKLMKDGAIESFDELYKSGQKTFRELGGTAMKGFANGVSSGMAAIGKALVKGQDIFKAFAGAMLSALGQAAIQMGATYILMGIARGLSSYGFDATAGELIATGSAMSVLGGAMMAVGEGVSGAAAPTAGGAGSVGSSSGSSVSSAAFDAGSGVNNQSVQGTVDNGAKVTVNIHGSVFDSNETGMRIIDIINEAGLSSGGKVLAT